MIELKKRIKELETIARAYESELTKLKDDNKLLRKALDFYAVGKESVENSNEKTTTVRPINPSND